MAFKQGYKQTEENRLKISIANTGRVRSPETREKCRIANLGKTPWNAGKFGVFSEETKRLMREAKIGKAPPSHKPNCQCFRCSPKHGALNHNFISGCTDIRNKLRRQLRQWSRDVMMRDHFTCVVCHSVGGKLNAHHIKKFSDHPDLRLVVSNGVTLCEPCHISVRRKEQEYQEIFASIVKALN